MDLIRKIVSNGKRKDMGQLAIMSEIISVIIFI